MAKLMFVKEVHINSIGNLPLKSGSCSFKISGYKRDYVAGVKSIDSGYMERSEPAELNLVINAKEEVDIQALKDITKVDVIVTLSDNHTWVMPQSWLMHSPEFSDGEIKLSFNSVQSQFLS